MNPKHASPVACLSYAAKVIRSLRDDVQNLAYGGMNVQMVARS